MICLVAHDAGGAELLSSWARNQKFFFLFSIKGPAKLIFKRKFKNFRNSSTKIIKKKTSLFITGTSKISNHELSYIKYGKNKNIKTISFIDHWVNYKERFLRKDEIIQPDELWVTDKFAFKLAKKKFKKKILLKPNYFIKDFLKEYKKKSKKIKKKNIVLYLSTNTGNNKADLEKLNFFLKKYDHFSEKKISIIIKVHPSESVSKYQLFKKKFNSIQIVKNIDLVELLIKSKYVVGYNSMAMYLASFINKNIYHANNNLKNNILPIKLKKLEKVFKN